MRIKVIKLDLNKEQWENRKNWLVAFDRFDDEQYANLKIVRIFLTPDRLPWAVEILTDKGFDIDID